MNTLLSTIGDWFSKNWIILVLIVVAVALLVPTYLRQRKEVNEKNELNNTIKKGTKIITTAGVYGVVESIRETTDGKVVTIVTGNPKNPSTMDIHINAIAGIDNKSAVTVEKTEMVENTSKKEEIVKEQKIETAQKEATTETSDKEIIADKSKGNEDKKPQKKVSNKKTNNKTNKK